MAKSGWDKWREKKAREAERALKKSAKKANIAYIIIAIAVFAAGFYGVYFGLSKICANDSFKINGEQIITFTEGDSISYADEGISYVSIGRDYSDKVNVKCDLQLKDGKFFAENAAIGDYPIIYTAVGGRCDGQTLYRVIRVLPAEGGDVQ